MNNFSSPQDALYSELVTARFAYEDQRTRAEDISALSRAADRLMQARQAVSSPRVHSAA